MLVFRHAMNAMPFWHCGVSSRGGCTWLQVNNMDVVPRLLGTSMEFLHSYMAAYVPALGVRADGRTLTGTSYL
jgi:hypothetical protein